MNAIVRPKVVISSFIPHAQCSLFNIWNRNKEMTHESKKDSYCCHFVYYLAHQLRLGHIRLAHLHLWIAEILQSLNSQSKLFRTMSDWMKLNLIRFQLKLDWNSLRCESRIILSGEPTPTNIHAIIRPRRVSWVSTHCRNALRKDGFGQHDPLLTSFNLHTSSPHSYYCSRLMTPTSGSARSNVL